MTTKLPIHITKMRAVAKDIILFNRKRTDLTQKQVMSRFYKIMAKHGIKQGEWTKHGRSVANYEWTMCLSLMKEVHRGQQDIEILFTYPPLNLLAYNKKPKK